MTQTLSPTFEKPTTSSYAEAIASVKQVYLVEHYGFHYHVSKYRGDSRRTGQTILYRCVYNYHDNARYDGRNEYLLKDGSWGYTVGNETPRLFRDEDEVLAFAATLPAPRLHKPFAVGDRIRTVRPRKYGPKEAPQEAILTGTVTKIRTGGGFGFSKVAWDKGESYWAPTEPYAYDIEHLPAEEDPLA